MTNKCLKRAVNEVISLSHAEFVSASSTQAVLPWQQQRQALKTLKQVQGDGTYFNNNGFTLIELLVVVLIIGILAAIAVPQYQKAVEKSRMAGALTMVNNISRALDLYILQNGMPQDVTDMVSMTNNQDNLLDIEIGPLNDDKEMCAGDFCYSFYCPYIYGTCVVSAFRYSSEETDDDEKMIKYALVNKKSDSWELGCLSYEGTNSLQLCKSLEMHGATTLDCTTTKGAKKCSKWMEGR